MQLIPVLVLLSCSLLVACSVSPVTWEKRITEDNKYRSTVKLFYREKGQGQPLILLHGLAESSFTWRYLIDDLAKDYRVIAVDLKGFGQSPKPKDGHYSVYDQALAVRQLMDDQQIENATIIGHSLGGGVALTLALLDRPKVHRVNRLVLIDVAAYQQKLPSMLRELKRPFLGLAGLYFVSPSFQAKKAYQYAFYNESKIPADGVKEATANFKRSGSRYALAQTVAQMIPDDIKNVASKYQNLPHETLIIWGDKDNVVPPQYGHRLHASLKNSQLTLLADVGHMPQEEAPKRVLKLIQQFIAPNQLSSP
ncbi:MAG: alpha/beta fold hydrolase [Thiotrichaceae bacterium]|nr:alpha/beta fold hydrolase [Thiotrichaceae bacterium]